MSVRYRGGRAFGPEQIFDITLPQLVPKGFQYAQFSYGHSITIDVFGKGRNIEVGQTQPMDLCYPFLHGMSDVAI